MGAVKEVLASKRLKDRERHNSRLFVDLCENIHIHFREFRFVFSLDEYFEFIDIVSRSTQDVRNYLLNNPDYREGVYPTTIMVANGGQRQVKFLQNSPEPHRSAYHDERFAIELQEESVTDEIHVHWRDLRVALNRENFRDVAEAFAIAHRRLDQFESQYDYQRWSHPDRAIIDANQHDLDGSRMQGTVMLDVRSVGSYWFRQAGDDWYEVFRRDWQRNNDYIEALKARFRTGEPVTPVVVARPTEDGVHYLVNGHHRYLAAREAGRDEIEAIVLAETFEETEELRHAELLLKKFDERTGYEHRVTSFFNDFVAMKLNRFYRNDYRQRVEGQEPPTVAPCPELPDAGPRRLKLKRITKPLEDVVRRWRRSASKRLRIRKAA
jgi:hypothetical protein